MKNTPKSSRRGVALLIVLGCLVVTVPVCFGLVMFSTTNRTQHQLYQWTQIADDLRAAAESGPVQDWLLHQSDSIALPIDIIIPSVDILHDQWVLQFPKINPAQKYNCQVHISAWDQCGMVPLQDARSGSPLRLTLPEPVSTLLDRVPAQNTTTVGLDIFSSANSKYTIERHNPPVHSVFPIMQHGMSNHAFGAYIATHQTDHVSRININTAPIPLVESALNMAGRGGIEHIIEARSQGKRALVPAASNSGDTGQTAPQIAATSNNWAFRIDIQIGAIQRSWWIIYQKTSASNQWECVQRFVISD